MNRLLYALRWLLFPEDRPTPSVYVDITPERLYMFHQAERRRDIHEV